MSESTISHRTRSREVTVSTSTATSTTIDMADMAAGMVLVAGATETATLTLYGSHDNATYAALYGHDGQAATISVAAGGGASPLPDAVYPLRYVRLVAGSDLGTAASVLVMLKS